MQNKIFELKQYYFQNKKSLNTKNKHECFFPTDSFYASSVRTLDDWLSYYKTILFEVFDAINEDFELATNQKVSQDKELSFEKIIGEQKEIIAKGLSAGESRDILKEELERKYSYEFSQAFSETMTSLACAFAFKESNKIDQAWSMLVHTTIAYTYSLKAIAQEHKLIESKITSQENSNSAKGKGSRFSNLKEIFLSLLQESQSSSFKDYRDAVRKLTPEVIERHKKSCSKSKFRIVENSEEKSSGDINVRDVENKLHNFIKNDELVRSAYHLKKI